MKIIRKYVFQNGKKANANEINAEFDQVLDVLNGNIENENIKDGTILQSKIGFQLASPKFLGNAPTPNDLPVLFPNAQHGDSANTDDLSTYMYDSATMTWKKTGGAVATVSHSQLTGRNLADSHPTSAITGLDTKLSSIDTSITNIQTKDSAQDVTLADHTNIIQSLQADTGEMAQHLSLHDDQISTIQTDVGTLQTDKANAADVYTKTDTDMALSGKVSVTPYTSWSYGYVKKTGGNYAFGANVTTIIPFNSLQTDQGQEWNTAADSWNFIAKSNGVWTFSPNVVLVGLPASTDVYCYITVYVDRGSGYVSERVVGHRNYRSSPGGPQISGTTEIVLKQGDKLRFAVTSTAAASVAEHNGTFVTWAKVSN